MKKLFWIIIIILVIWGVYYLVTGNSGTPVPNNQNAVTETPSVSSNTITTSSTNSAGTVQTSTTTTTTTTNGTVTVTYTSAGFNPKTIEVAQGQTVTFLNESGNPLQVDSNPHPLHTSYPELNRTSSISNGQSFSFVFNKIGTWGYHNHLNPSDGGTVIVK